MASTPKNRGDWKRKKSPPNKETESLERKEDRLLNGLYDNIVAANTLVDRQGPYKNTANEVKIKLRELQKLCGRVMDVRRMRAEKEEEDPERTPKRAKKAVALEEKGTNTSTGGEMEGLEWDDELETETEWKEVKTKGKRRHQPRKREPVEIKEGIEVSKEKTKILKEDAQEKRKNNVDKHEILNRKRIRNTLNKAKQRPEALLVEVKNRDYASVLKEVKLGLANEEIVFSKVRKTKKGDILLELEKGQEGNASQIKEKVVGLCPSLTMRALKESKSIIIKGLDATVEKQEVEDCLKSRAKDFRIRSFWQNNYGNKTAVVELPREEAQKLVNEKKIKIGWMRVSVGFLIEKKRCYRCLEYGHIATVCSGQDRSKKCYNCGNDGHKARECKKETECVICKDEGQINTNHKIGAKSCPSWRKSVPGKRPSNPKNGLKEQGKEP